MLTSNDVKADLKKYLDLKKFESDEFKYAVIKGVRLAVRLLLSIRVNQVRIMKKVGVDLLETKREDNEKKSVE